jgi:hypothetical protein
LGQRVGRDLPNRQHPPRQEAPPVKLVWEFPDNLQQLMAPLEFHDVPLP